MIKTSPSQPLYIRLGLGESVLGYRDDFLTLALPCTPSLDFHIGRGLLRRYLGWASRGPIDAPCGPSVFIRTRYPHTQESWGHPLVSSPRVPGGLEESHRDSISSPFTIICAARLRVAGSLSHDNTCFEGFLS